MKLAPQATASVLLLALAWSSCSSPQQARTQDAPDRTPFEQAKHDRSLTAMEPLAWKGDVRAQAWLAERNYQLVEYPLSRFWVMKAAVQGGSEYKKVFHRFLNEGTPAVYLVGGEVSSSLIDGASETPLEKAKADYQQRWCEDYPNSNFTSAHDLLLPLAEQGVAAAQTALGHIYLEAQRPFKSDPKKALSWFEKAADQGDADALASLGAMYLEGFKVQKDVARSIQYLDRSIKAGHPYADFFLARANGVIEGEKYAALRREKERAYDARFLQALALYDAGKHGEAYAIWNSIPSHRKSRLRVLRCQLVGLGTKKQYGSAISELQVDRNEGKLDAMLLLGEVYETGLGTNVDLKRAREEFARADEKHYSTSARLAIDRIVRSQIERAATGQPTYEETDRGLRLAYGNKHYSRAYLLCKKSKGRYDPEANYVMGLLLYYRASPWEQDKKAGMALLGRAADHDHVEAMLVRANILLENNDTTIEAAKLIYNAALRRNTEAAYQWGLMCMEGYRTPMDNPAAIRFLTIAADKGHMRAMAKLGDAFHEGLQGQGTQARAMRLIGEPAKDPNYVAQSDYKAKEWWKKAAAKGHASSAYNLALMREAVSDFDAAVDYYKIAARGSHKEARYRLGMIYRYKTLFIKEKKGGWQELFELAASQGHKLAAREIAPAPELVAKESRSWKGGQRTGSNNNSSFLSAPQLKWKSNYKPYSGPKPWTQQYQQQRIMRDPTLGFKNRYKY